MNTDSIRIVAGEGFVYLKAVLLELDERAEGTSGVTVKAPDRMKDVTTSSITASGSSYKVFLELLLGAALVVCVVTIVGGECFDIRFAEEGPDGLLAVSAARRDSDRGGDLVVVGDGHVFELWITSKGEIYKVFYSNYAG